MILKSSEDKSPYVVAFHVQGCPETIWADEEELLSEKEIVGRKCEACRVEHRLWTEIIKQTGEDSHPTTLYGDLANRGLRLRTRVVDFHYPIDHLDAFDYLLVEIVHEEVKRRESFKIWEKNKEIESK